MRHSTPSSQVEINLTPSRVYQEYLNRMLKEKLNDVNVRMEKVVHDANTEIAVLQNKLSGKFVQVPKPIQ